MNFSDDDTPLVHLGDGNDVCVVTGNCKTIGILLYVSGLSRVISHFHIRLWLWDLLSSNQRSISQQDKERRQHCFVVDALVS